MRFDIPVFSGMRPIIDPRLLEPQQAQVAADCLVSSGALKALRRMRVEARLAVRGVQDILRYGGQWITFFEPVSVCQSLVASDELDRVYYTGLGSGAMMFRRAEGGGASMTGGGAGNPGGKGSTGSTPNPAYDGQTGAGGVLHGGACLNAGTIRANGGLGGAGSNGGGPGGAGSVNIAQAA